MLQRIQSLWLLLAGVLSFLTVKFNIYSGTKVLNGANLFTALNGSANFLILTVTIAIGLIAMITIFLYKNRPLQIKLSLVFLLLYILLAFLYYLKIKDFTAGNFSLTSVFFFLIPVLIILAIKGIYNDQKLIKSVDRLRN
ncbi:MAG: DUF4293 family protein [Chitinophagaceae bacterium]|nr:DUF4293 family protein [Chitinophagaceae bacterium]MCW5926746.1 DUF4293 family protein [Chitinophagaceae bacterium]